MVPSVKTSSLRRGLVHAVYQAGGAPVDVLRPGQAWTVGAGGAGSVKYMRRAKGLNCDSPGSSNVGFSFSGPTEVSRRVSDWPATIVAYVRRERLATTVDVLFGSRNTATPFSNFALLATAGELPSVGYNAGGTGSSLNARTATGVGDESVVAAVVTPRRQMTFVNGCLETEGTVVAGSGPTYGAARYFTWGGTGATVELFHTIAVGYVYRRLLSSAELRAIAADPLLVLRAA